MLTWILQQSHSKDFALIADACDQLNVSYQCIEYTPFSNTLPDLEEKEYMFYGSTGLISAVEKSGRYKPGVISIDSQWTNHLKVLNYGQYAMTLRTAYKALPNQPVFIRPLQDDKLFSGQIMQATELTNWIKDLEEKDLKEVLATPVLVSTVKQIPNEWRCFIVNGRYVTGSHYRSYGQLMTSSDVPKNVVNFVNRNLFPFFTYVIDICLTEDKELKIVELNGFNSSGFYASDVVKLVESINHEWLKTY